MQFRSQAHTIRVTYRHSWASNAYRAITWPLHLSSETLHVSARMYMPQAILSNTPRDICILVFQFVLILHPLSYLSCGRSSVEVEVKHKPLRPIRRHIPKYFLTSRVIHLFLPVVTTATKGHRLKRLGTSGPHRRFAAFLSQVFPLIVTPGTNRFNCLGIYLPHLLEYSSAHYALTQCQDLQASACWCLSYPTYPRAITLHLH